MNWTNNIYMARSQTCRSKHAIHHDLFQAFDSFLDSLRDEDAFASCEATCLEYHLEAACLDVFHGLLVLSRSKDSEFGRWDIVTIHERLGEGFGAFHPSRKLRGAKDRYSDLLDVNDDVRGHYGLDKSPLRKCSSTPSTRGCSGPGRT